MGRERLRGDQNECWMDGRKEGRKDILGVLIAREETFGYNNNSPVHGIESVWRE
jgi:hypothetical protein